MINKTNWREVNKKRLLKNPYHYKEVYQSRKNKKNYKLAHKKAVLKNIKKNPEKQRARILAILNISIPTNYLCDFCGKSLASNRHHKDYLKPLEVKLICTECHKNVHKTIRRINKNDPTKDRRTCKRLQVKCN